MSKIRLAVVSALLFCAVGCSAVTGNPGASDPTERGLSCIAVAIVAAAIVRAVFNK